MRTTRLAMVAHGASSGGEASTLLLTTDGRVYGTGRSNLGALTGTYAKLREER